MDTLQFYASRTDHFRAQYEILKKKETFWAFARLFAFAGFVIITFFAFSISGLIGILAMLPALAVFGLVINYHLKTLKEKLKNLYLLEINIAEADCVQGNYSNFANGQEYNEKEHPYLNDLDILGPHSLFQYVNRTNTQPGATMLAEWLKRPAAFHEIGKRQNAVKELSTQVEWRQTLRSVFYINPSSINSPDKLIDWCNSPSEFPKAEYLGITLWILSFAMLGSASLWIMGSSSAWLTLLLLTSVGINYRYIMKINKIQNNLSRSYAMLESYADIIRHIENSNFHSEKLVELKSKLNGKMPASGILKQLSRLSKKLDYRLNILIGIPLNLLFLWDIHQCLKLEQWKAENREKIAEWFIVMA